MLQTNIPAGDRVVADDIILMPEHERELSGLLLRVFQETLALAGPTTLDSISQTVAVMHRCVTATLAPELRSHNARLATIARLPGEVLCKIWELLPIDDRVAISHVCSFWRSLAINTLGLWTELDFHTSVHDDSCNCSACSKQGTRSALNRDWIPGRTNLGVFRNVLSRSGLLPLTVGAEFRIDATPFGHARDLAKCLQPHLHRLEILSFHVQSPGDLAWFFDGLSSPFPKLRELRCTSPNEQHFDYRYITLPDLPHAETVIVQGAVVAVNWSKIQLPLIRHLHWRCQNDDDILRALTACPKLESLTIEMALTRSTASSATHDLIHAHISRSQIRDVTVLYARGWMGSSVLPIVHVPSLRRLHMQFSGPSHPSGFAIFQDLGDDIHLCMTVRNMMDLVTATDSAGMCRSIQYHINAAHFSLWKYISHSAVTSLAFSVREWSDVRTHMPVLSSVHSAALSVSSDAILLVSHISKLQQTTPAPLPGLETLLLSSTKNLKEDGPSARPVPVAYVKAILTSLKGSAARIDKLALDGILLDGDRKELGDLIVRIVE
ncbi:hypothetical protein EXIGLDRAFT_845746 [Exidia glandulosa HHB12029]|uniref:F-box domain-containing protein n=1 Tax=Exidia glandulosa HHB12029 TaxID=1314781 RepID=A0A165BAU9_EXIGL|nr:hypothetical protein EXIGLDRAFT_845746 [Exidia glandulosa HHB12029]